MPKLSAEVTMETRRLTSAQRDTKQAHGEISAALNADKAIQETLVASALERLELAVKALKSMKGE